MSLIVFRTDGRARIKPMRIITNRDNFQQNRGKNYEPLRVIYGKYFFFNE